MKKNVTSAADRATRDTSIMPYFWNSDDTRRAIISSAIPFGAYAASAVALSKDRDYLNLLDVRLFLLLINNVLWIDRV